MENRFFLPLFSLFSSLFILNSCQVGPHYCPPSTPSPTEWKGSNEKNDDLPRFCHWWEVFQDETLNHLEKQAIENNPNLHLMLARIEEAWALTGVSRSDLFPQVNLNPGYSSTGSLFKIFLPNTSTSGSTQLGTTQLQTPFRIHQLQLTLPFNMNYELDLWGKQRNQYESEINHAQAEEKAYETALLTLTSNVASAYFNLRSLDAIVGLYEATIKTHQKAYELTVARFENGLINYDNVANQSLELSNTKSDNFEIIRQRGIQENMIASLLGIPASNFHLPHTPLLENLPKIPSGIPSEIIQRRPDIAEAERKMASEHAQIGVAYASFFPSLTLTANLGFSSPDLKSFLTGQSSLWSIGSNAAQTIFDAGEKKSLFNASLARFTQAKASYQQLVLTAFEEVENALNNLEFQKKQSESLESAVNSASQLTQLSLHNYQQGLINVFEVINRQQSELAAKRNYVNLVGMQYQSTIQLIKAFGGGWN